MKKIQALHDAIGITSIEDLEAACLKGSVSAVRGFGKKTQQKILEGIESYRNREQKEILFHAVEVARAIISYLQGLRSVQRAEPAGDVRRWCEVTSCIDVLAVTDDPAATIKGMTKFPLVTRVEKSAGQYQCSVRLANGGRALEDSTSMPAG